MDLSTRPGSGPSTILAASGFFDADESADALMQFIAAGGNSTYEMSDLKKYPKAVSHCCWMLDAVIGGQDLVRIGEETGDVPGSLNNLADTYEGELQISLRVMTNLIEPVLIILMAVIVGFLLLSILLPMFNLISHISTSGGGH